MKLKLENYSEQQLRYGQCAYRAYGAAVDWKAYNGEDMPKWPDLPERIKCAWIESALGLAVELIDTIHETAKQQVVTSLNYDA